VAGGAAGVLLVSLSCPLPLLRSHPPSLLDCCLFVFVDSLLKGWCGGEGKLLIGWCRGLCAVPLRRSAGSRV